MSQSSEYYEEQLSQALDAEASLSVKVESFQADLRGANDELAHLRSRALGVQQQLVAMAETFSAIGWHSRQSDLMALAKQLGDL